MKLLRASVLFLFLLFSTHAWATYTKQIIPGTPLETPANNWAAGDDDSKLVNLGFTFPFGSAGNITQLYINSNGGLASTSWSTYSNSALPQNNPPVIIAPYWDDIYRRNGTIKYGTFGTAPNRHFVAAWANTPRYSNSGSCTFQVVLYENGDIRFRYSTASVSCDGGSGKGSATVGIQESKTVFNQHSYNTSLDLTKDILYSENLPAISLQKTSRAFLDPMNGDQNPKSIPGGIIEYTLTVKNNGSGIADNNSIVLSDSIPANTVLYVDDIAGVGSGPIAFAEGNPPSDLDYQFISLGSTDDDVSFSKNNGDTYDYTPVPDALGVDNRVTDIRVAMQGVFLANENGGAANAPRFQLKFRVMIE